MMHQPPSRGFTLLTAVILSSIVLSLGIALLDVSYKETVLASATKNSDVAFYNADAAMECALYWDNKQANFAYSALPTNVITCSNQGIDLTASPNSSTVSGSTRTTTFNIPCATTGVAGRVVITKTSANATSIYATGYSSCSDTDPRRIERGLKTNY